MAERRVEHSFPCSREKYWKLFFEPAFNQALFLEHLEFERWEVTAMEPLAHGFRRQVEAVPKPINLPGPLKRVMQKGTGYREEGEFDEQNSIYRLNAISHSLPERLHVTGDVRVEPRDGGGCARIYVATADARVFGVGGILEGKILDDLEGSLNRAADFTRRWLEEHPNDD